MAEPAEVVVPPLVAIIEKYQGVDDEVLRIILTEQSQEAVKKLHTQQMQFAINVALKDMNEVQAALDAGYSEHTVNRTVIRLKKLEYLNRAIETLQAEKELLYGFSKETMRRKIDNLVAVNANKKPTVALGAIKLAMELDGMLSQELGDRVAKIVVNTGVERDERPQDHIDFSASNG